MSRQRSAIALMAAATVLLAGCTASGGGTVDSRFDPTAIAAARTAALAAAGGEKIGGSVNIMGVLGGEELDDFEAVLTPFEDATGIDVKYEGTRDFGAVLQTRLDGGNPPELAATPALGLISQLAREDAVVDLRTIIDDETLTANYDQGLLDTATADGVLYGLFTTVNLNGLIWYNPAVYDGPTDPARWSDLQDWVASKAADGITPWCVALESGAGSGWPAADFIDEIVLREAGPEFHAQWRDGEVPWDSPEIKHAFETYGTMVQSGNVYGDVNSILSTNFANGADPEFGAEPQCLIHQQATFMAGIIGGNFPDLTPGQDFDFFPVPDFSEEFAGTRAVGGEVISMFVETPQSTALVKYLTSTEAGTLIAATGRWLSPNRGVGPSSYTDSFLGRASEILGESAGSYTLANSFMPQALVDAFYRACLEYVQNPSDLDAILREVETVSQHVR